MGVDIHSSSTGGYRFLQTKQKKQTQSTQRKGPPILVIQRQDSRPSLRLIWCQHTHGERAMLFWLPTLKESHCEARTESRARTAKLTPSIRPLGYQTRLQILDNFCVERLAYSTVDAHLSGQLSEILKVFPSQIRKH